MKFAKFVLAGILLLGSLALIQAAGPSRVALAFTGGSVYTSNSTGICVWYFPVVGKVDQKSLFMESIFQTPMVDREHAYLVWVSDFTVKMLPTNGAFTVALIPAGTGTIYFSDRPDLRNWKDLNDRSTWGEPVAKFVRQAGMFQSTDGGTSGTFTFTADLVSSSVFKLNGKMVSLRELVPHGMTCSETGGVDGTEAGTCVAAGASF